LAGWIGVGGFMKRLIVLFAFVLVLSLVFVSVVSAQSNTVCCEKTNSDLNLVKQKYSPEEIKRR